MTNDPTPEERPSKLPRLPRDEQRVITYALVGFMYLAFLAGVGMILFGPSEKVNDSRVNLLIIGPLLNVVGYLTGRRSASTDTGGGANVGAANTVVIPPAPAASSGPLLEGAPTQAAPPDSKDSSQ